MWKHSSVKKKKKRNHYKLNNKQTPFFSRSFKKSVFEDSHTYQFSHVLISADSDVTVLLRWGKKAYVHYIDLQIYFSHDVKVGCGTIKSAHISMNF